MGGDRDEKETEMKKSRPRKMSAARQHVFFPGWLVMSKHFHSFFC